MSNEQELRSRFLECLEEFRAAPEASAVILTAMWMAMPADQQKRVNENIRRLRPFILGDAA